MLNEHNIKLVSNIDEDIYMESYQNEFEQVILNLISNAKDALVYDKIDTPTLQIDAYKTEENIQIEIKDNAKGIKADILDKIFEPYFTTKEEAEGTGIGLYMSKIIIEQNMKGKITACSAPEGSTFMINFNSLKS
jgi:signal transduction histidine kinase